MPTSWFFTAAPQARSHSRTDNKNARATHNCGAPGQEAPQHHNGVIRLEMKKWVWGQRSPARVNRNQGQESTCMHLGSDRRAQTTEFALGWKILITSRFGDVKLSVSDVTFSQCISIAVEGIVFEILCQYFDINNEGKRKAPSSFVSDKKISKHMKSFMTGNPGVYLFC